MSLTGNSNCRPTRPQELDVHRRTGQVPVHRRPPVERHLDAVDQVNGVSLVHWADIRVTRISQDNPRPLRLAPDEGPLRLLARDGTIWPMFTSGSSSSAFAWANHPLPVSPYPRALGRRPPGAPRTEGHCRCCCGPLRSLRGRACGGFHSPRQPPPGRSWSMLDPNPSSLSSYNTIPFQRPVRTEVRPDRHPADARDRPAL